MSETYFTTSDNCHLYYEYTPANKDILFFVYGLGCSIAHWKYQIEYLKKKGYSILWYDLRGHEKSDNGSKLVTLDQIARDSVELLKHLKIEKVHILGQSLGGTIATEIAADYPGKIHSVVLLTSPVRPVSRGWKLGWLATYLWKEAIRANSLNPEIVKTIFNLLPKVRLLVREMIRLNGFNIALAKTKDIDEYVEHLLETNIEIFFRLARDLEIFDGISYAQKIKCPVLMIGGENDLIVPPSEFDWYAKYLKDPRIVIMPNGSHCPHLDDPQFVNQALEHFYSSMS